MHRERDRKGPPLPRRLLGAAQDGKAREGKVRAIYRCARAGGAGTRCRLRPPRRYDQPRYIRPRPRSFPGRLVKRLQDGEQSSANNPFAETHELSAALRRHAGMAKRARDALMKSMRPTLSARRTTRTDGGWRSISSTGRRLKPVIGRADRAPATPPSCCSPRLIP